ncbi:squalene/phytoene synthase family protein [Paracoccus xiamenensis]|uniref:squalene/phytoene synthase family protein n=1 Tax=Paracoccus xiamenensis TaxID=2714901 RepID=UPI001408F380|nr:squalene/phytoene synthase family protein [Paracoccus xiamenensis]NHF72496.1 squalene/phytoene synthase family protein [Paracoccus xiamenensis]
MTPEHCAEMLRSADPDRFACVMAARPGDRARLATLYAANLEIARAALASAEPLISQMRLQWWTDQIAAIAAGRAVPAHEVASPLAAAWGSDIAPLAEVVEARQRDALREPFSSKAEVIDHVEGCTGGLMRLAATACGSEADDVLQDQARGAGLAAWLGAYPQLRELNLGLFGDPPEQLADLARTGIAALDSAHVKGRGVPRHAAPALYPGAGARRKLLAAARGEMVEISGFSRNLSYLALSFLGRWQG